MNPLLGKYLIAVGTLLLLAGLVVVFAGNRLHWPDWLIPGRLPGDIRLEGKNGGGFYFPIMTCVIVSVLLSLLMALFRRLF